MSVTHYGGEPVEVVIRATYRPWPVELSGGPHVTADVIAGALAGVMPAALGGGSATLTDLSVEIVEESS